MSIFPYKDKLFNSENEDMNKSLHVLTHQPQTNINNKNEVEELVF